MMKRLLVLYALSLVVSISLFAQSPAQIQVISGNDPAGPCSPRGQSNPTPPLQFNVQNGHYIGCTGTPPNLVWTLMTPTTGLLAGDGKGGTIANTNPIVASTATSVVDSNSNSVLLPIATASAVDQLSITNGATANPATVLLSTTGTDSNINLALTAKGTGIIVSNDPMSFAGSSTGSAAIGVAAAAGTPAQINLPVATGAVDSVLQSNGATPQVTSWQATTGTGNLLRATAVPNAQFCGTTTTCSATAITGAQIVYGSAALVSGTPSTAAVTGISPAFTSASSYSCTLNNKTTRANDVSVLVAGYVSGSAFTITGPDTVTDVVNYVCVGN